MLTIILVLMPQFCRDLIIKENLGKGSKRRDEEMTTDNDGESELTELSTAPQAP